MKFNALLLLPIFLVVLVHQASSQNRFIVAVIERLKAMPNSTRELCPASIITDRHVVTAGDCTQPSSSQYELMVSVQITEQIGSIVVSGSSTVGVDRVFVHPNKTATSNNIGVIMIDGRFNVTILPPRKLEFTHSNATCNLYGWYGALEPPTGVAVQVFSPEFCDPSLPQTYCTFLPSNTSNACFASKGSPLVCSTGDVNAILLSSRSCGFDHLNRTVLQFNSIGDSKAWIEQVSGAEITTKLSAILLVSAVLVALKNFS